MARSRRRRERPGPSGFLVVDKPMGVTSHDVVDAARRWFGTRRVGHLGTLDPRATGVLPLAVRDATRLIPFVEGGHKVYVGAIELGIATDTFDAEGEVLHRHDGPLPDLDGVAEALRGFVGEIEQIPPMYSSVKHAGEPLYRIARRGEEVERQPRRVRVHALELLRYEPPKLGIRVDCDPGTYVRCIAQDLGERLGCGGTLVELRRTRSGRFAEEDAVPMEAMDAAAADGKAEARLMPPVAVLGLPTLRLDEDQVRRVRHGAEVAPPPAGRPPDPGARVSAVDPAGNLVAVLEARPDRRFRPLRVLAGEEAL